MKFAVFKSIPISHEETVNEDLYAEYSGRKYDILAKNILVSEQQNLRWFEYLYRFKEINVHTFKSVSLKNTFYYRLYKHKITQTCDVETPPKIKNRIRYLEEIVSRGCVT
ncbi:predicted protein [Coccidioides posadasii str. Silveira]|uniref:Predicted protein n=2 Tax=Coccidioides posadasii TaxID=199306 RepID=E9CVR7_COCPS|nr:predicted protein [Coccidioides posadasii str. Silveira]KMM64869.1 hypothetical protein CPAG_01221 [Coccidioides posadasii RMSCC 3488]